jgi:hypothetical protein
MRRRVQAVEDLEMPRSLVRFRPEEWLDGTEKPPPVDWPPSERWLWWGIQAVKRYTVAGREWRREHGVSLEDWELVRKGH